MDRKKLLELLQSLEPFEELNILILDPTGVGKSTWINTFVNCLEYQTLDEALQAEKFIWRIPFSFSLYNLDDSGNYKRLQVEEGIDEAASPFLSNTEANIMSFEHN